LLLERREQRTVRFGGDREGDRGDERRRDDSTRDRDRRDPRDTERRDRDRDRNRDRDFDRERERDRNRDRDRGRDRQREPERSGDREPRAPIDLRDLRYQRAPIDLDKLVDKGAPRGSPNDASRKRKLESDDLEPNKRPKVEPEQEEGEVHSSDDEAVRANTKRWSDSDDEMRAPSKKRWNDSDDEGESKKKKKAATASANVTSPDQLGPELGPSLPTGDSDLVILPDAPEVEPLPEPEKEIEKEVEIIQETPPAKPVVVKGTCPSNPCFFLAN